MLISSNFHKKGSEVSIKKRSTPAALSCKGQAIKHTTVKNGLLKWKLKKYCNLQHWMRHWIEQDSTPENQAVHTLDYRPLNQPITRTWYLRDTSYSYRLPIKTTSLRLPKHQTPTFKSMCIFRARAFLEECTRYGWRHLPLFKSIPGAACCEM